MKLVSQRHTDVWRSGEYTGADKPMQRATLQVFHLAATTHGKDVYAQYLFSQPWIPVELPNVKSINYDRSVDTDAATCRLELYNTKALPLGTAVTSDDFGNYIFDQPGYYTFNRGTTTHTQRWHHTPNEWQSLIVPDRMIRTYEGYGFDPTVGPDFDPNQTQSGVWIIDEVTYEATGTITVNCRDAGRLLIDQITFPPVVPKTRYPLTFTSNHPVANAGGETASTTWTQPAYQADSSSYGHDGPDADIHGHRASDAFDGTSGAEDYWLSVGYNVPDGSFAFEWIQGTFTSQDVTAVDVTTRGGPYVCYVSVWSQGAWQGAGTIPYKPETSTTPNQSNIKYVKSQTIGANTRTVIKLGTKVTAATKVRLTFTNLYNSKLGSEGFPKHTYRAAIYGTRVSGNYAVYPNTGTHIEGDFGDYSEIVKRLLAYGGFHWPNDPSQAFHARTDGSLDPELPNGNDPYLGSGRIWGDIMMARVASIEGTTLDATVWDKKSLMDGIAYVRDILGFNFFIDEVGKAVFRTPNVWRVGNYQGELQLVPEVQLPYSFSDDFDRPDNQLIGNGWIQGSGGDFYIDTNRAITKSQTGFMSQETGHRNNMMVQATVRSPDNMQPCVYLWSNETAGGHLGYCLALGSAEIDTNLEIRRSNQVVAVKQLGAVGVAIGNVDKVLRLEASQVGATVFVKAYVDGVLELEFNEPVGTAPTGSWAGLGNLGLLGENGAVFDNVTMSGDALPPGPVVVRQDYVDGVEGLVTIDENETLEQLSVTLSSRNMRDRVFIANTSGLIGATAVGHTGPNGPYDNGLRRVAGWTDQHFASNAECNVMADLIALRQLFTYRTDRLTIPGYSAIQIDDQVRILEGTTSEDYIHYVKGVSSSWDIETGVWTYTLDTHWLGETPFTEWAFNPDNFTEDTLAFLQANGSI